MTMFQAGFLAGVLASLALVALGVIATVAGLFVCWFYVLWHN